MIDIPNGAAASVLSFVRQDEKNKVFAVFNLSSADKRLTFAEQLCHGAYVDYFSQESVNVDEATAKGFEPWAYRVLVAQDR